MCREYWEIDQYPTRGRKMLADEYTVVGAHEGECIMRGCEWRLAHAMTRERPKLR
jgi:hypothetical protein